MQGTELCKSGQQWLSDYGRPGIQESQRQGTRILFRGRYGQCCSIETDEAEDEYDFSAERRSPFFELVK